MRGAARDIEGEGLRGGAHGRERLPYSHCLVIRFSRATVSYIIPLQTPAEKHLANATKSRCLL